MTELRSLRPSDVAAAVALWRACGLTRPWNDPWRDAERMLGAQPDLFLAAVDGDALVGTAMAGWDGHRGWIHYLAVDPQRQGEGLGRLLVDEAERRLTALGCPKAMLMVRAGNERVVGFYEALGYAVDEVVVLGKRLIPDS